MLAQDEVPRTRGPLLTAVQTTTATVRAAHKRTGRFVQSVFLLLRAMCACQPGPTARKPTLHGTGAGRYGGFTAAKCRKHPARQLLPVGARPGISQVSGIRFGPIRAL